MKKLDNNEKISILQVLKIIFIDNTENTNEIPGLDKIVPTSPEEAKLLDELKKDEAARAARISQFKRTLAVTPLKMKQLANEQENEKAKRIKEQGRTRGD